MRLSDAIRLGSMLKPQGRGPQSIEGTAVASCALGAASDALGIASGTVSRYAELSRMYRDIRGTHPARTSMNAYPAISIVWELNDIYHWSRERIADWVEGLELAQEQPVIEPSAELVPVLVAAR